MNELYTQNCSKIGNDDYESSSSSSSSSSSESSSGNASGDEFEEGIRPKRGEKAEPENDRTVIKRLITDLEKTGCTFEFKTRHRTFSVTTTQNKLQSVVSAVGLPSSSSSSSSSSVVPTGQQGTSASPLPPPPPLFVFDKKGGALSDVIFLRYNEPLKEAAAPSDDEGSGTGKSKTDSKDVSEFVDAVFDYKNGGKTTKAAVVDLFCERFLGSYKAGRPFNDLPPLVAGSDDEDDESLYDLIEDEMTQVCQELEVSIDDYISTSEPHVSKSVCELAKNKTLSTMCSRTKCPAGLTEKKESSNLKVPQNVSKTIKQKPKKDETLGTQGQQQQQQQRGIGVRAQMALVPQASSLVQKALRAKEGEEEEDYGPYVVGRCCLPGCKESGGKIMSTDNYSEFRCTAKCVFMLHKKCIKLYDTNLNNGFGGNGNSSSVGGSGAGSVAGGGTCGCNYVACPTPSCWGKIMSVKRVSWENGVRSEKTIVVIKRDQIKKLFGPRHTKRVSAPAVVPSSSSSSLSSGNAKKPRRAKKKPEKPLIVSSPQKLPSILATTQNHTKVKPEAVVQTLKSDQSKSKDTEKHQHPQKQLSLDAQKEQMPAERRKTPEIVGIESDNDEVKVFVSRKELGPGRQNSCSPASQGVTAGSSDQKKPSKKKASKKELHVKKNSSFTPIQQIPEGEQAQEQANNASKVSEGKKPNREEEGGSVAGEEKSFRWMLTIHDIPGQGDWNRADYPPWAELNKELFLKMDCADKKQAACSVRYKSVFGTLFN